MTSAATRSRASHVAVVTGARGSVGGAIATRLTHLGFEVVCPIRPGRAPVRGAARSVTCDLASAAEVARLADTLSAASPAPLVLVNCAAEVGLLRPLAETDPQAWQRVMQVNFGAAVQLSLAVLPGMLRAGFGRIVNVSSAAGLAPAPPGMGPYAVSKTCLNRFTAQLGAELPDGVTAHALHPGDIASSMWREIKGQADDDERLEDLRAWAAATGTDGDDASAAADLVERLLDPATARDTNGHFLWPEQHAAPALDLRTSGWPAVSERADG